MPRILIVEDDQSQAARLRRILQTMGYDVMGIETTAIGGIELAKKQRPDLILMDIVIPGPMDGIEAAIRIRESLAIPIVFLSGHTDSTTLKRAMKAMPYGYVVKPFYEENLRVNVELALHAGQRDQEFQEREDILKTILQSLEEVVFSTTLEGEILFFNQGADCSFGPSFEQYISRRIQLLRFAVLDNGSTRSEYKIENADGGKRWVSERIWLISDEQGQPQRFEGIVVDITEQKNMMEALRNNEEKIRSIISVIPDLLLRLNENGEFLEVWSKDSMLLPVPEHVLIGNSVEEVLPQSVAQLYTLHIERARKAQKLQTFEYSLPINKEERCFEARFMASGTQGVVAIIRDITKRKKQEERIAYYTRELEIKNRDLEQTQDKLNENIAKGSQLHEWFFPRTYPDIPELSFSSIYMPAEKLGGDFFHVLKFQNQLLIYLVDVSGHGLDGAIMTVFVRETINTYLAMVNPREDTISPTAMLRYLKEQFNKEAFSDDYFLCIFVGVLDLNTFGFAYSGAAMLNPLLCDEFGKVQSLAVDGLPISNAIEAELIEFKEKETLIQPNSTLLMFTDGIVEETQGEEMYGEQRIEAILKAQRGNSPESIGHVLQEDFLAFKGQGALSDDVTCFLLQRNGINRDI